MIRSFLVVWWLAASTAWGQQSLFNVPSTQETLPGRLFGQVQATATPNGGEVNTTLELGITRWLEIGVNLLRMPLYRLHDVEERAPAQSATLFNANVWVDPLAWLAFEFGVQAGVGTRPGALSLEPVVFGWATARFEAPGRFGSYVVGGYAGTRGALGHGPPAGGLVGVEVPLIEHRLHAVADWVIGLNDLSVAVVGLVVFVGKNFQLSVGGQLPSPGSGNAFGGVFELTYVPNPLDPAEGLGDPSQRPQLRNPPRPGP